MEYGLTWDALVELFGGEIAVHELLEKCEPSADDQTLSKAKDLGYRYLGGWRPNPFGPQ